MGRLGDDARVPAQVGLAGLQVGGDGEAVGVGVRIGGVVALVLRRERVACRSLEGHRVATRGQPVEQVVAIGIGALARDDVAIGIEQIDRDAGNTGLVGVLRAVAILVEPDLVADRGFTVQASIERDVALTGTDGDVVGHAVGRIDIRIGRVVTAGVLGGQHIAGRRLDGHRVGARCNVEAVEAVAVGGGGVEHVAERVLEQHGDTGNARLTCILHAVGVAVLPHPVTDMGRLGDDARVQRIVVLAVGQRDDLRLAGHRIRVRIERVVTALILPGEFVALRQIREHDLVLGTDGQAIEAIVAVGIGGGLVGGVVGSPDDAIGATANQCHGHALDARLAGLEHTVTVVVPDRVAQRRVLRRRSDRDGRGRLGDIAVDVGDLVGEAVGAGEAGIRRVGEGAVRIDHHRAVGRVGELHPDVAAVGTRRVVAGQARRDRRAFAGAVGVVDRDRHVIDVEYGHRERVRDEVGIDATAIGIDATVVAHAEVERRITAESRICLEYEGAGIDRRYRHFVTRRNRDPIEQQLAARRQAVDDQADEVVPFDRIGKAEVRRGEDVGSALVDGRTAVTALRRIIDRLDIDVDAQRDDVSVRIQRDDAPTQQAVEIGKHRQIDQYAT